MQIYRLHYIHFCITLEQNLFDISGSFEGSGADHIIFDVGLVIYVSQRSFRRSCRYYLSLTSEEGNVCPLPFSVLVQNVFVDLIVEWVVLLRDAFASNFVIFFTIKVCCAVRLWRQAHDPSIARVPLRLHVSWPA